MHSANEDTKEEYSVMIDNYSEMSSDESRDDSKVNYGSFQEESIKIEYTKWDDFIKNEEFDSCSEAEQWPQVQNKSSRMQDIVSKNQSRSPNCAQILARLDNLSENIVNSNNYDNDMESKNVESNCFGLSAYINDEDKPSTSVDMGAEKQLNIIAIKAEDDDASTVINNKAPNGGLLQEFGNLAHFEKCNKNLEMDSADPLGLLERCDRSDYMNYIVKIENGNVSTACGKSSTKLGCLSPEVAINVEPDDNYLKKRPTQMLSNKPDYCKLPEYYKNIDQQIVDTSKLHTNLLPNYRMTSTRMNKDSAHEILDIDNFEVNKDIMRHTKEKPYKCNSCDYTYSQKGYLKIHMLTHSDEKPYKCNSCDYASSQKSCLKIHMSIHNGKKPYKCNCCGYASSQRGYIKRHMLTHTGEKPYKCRSCDFTTSQKSNLKVHMMNHTGEKPHKCNSCDYASSQKSNLKIHFIRNHTEDKPYKCNFCDYASSQKGCLKMHMLTHTGEKPYKCSSCDYASTHKASLKIHMANHSGEKPFKCISCDYASSCKSSLKRHTMIHTKEKQTNAITII